MTKKRVAEMPPVMILCGGQGTRIRDVTELLPKPMVPVGNQPILWHIMKGYSVFGVKRFILCLGYKREEIIDYFLNYNTRATDITVRLGQQHDITYHGAHAEEDWEVTLADTGEKTMTGGRVFRAVRYLRDTDRDFFLTYGDAVADIDLNAQLNYHREMGRLLTVTAVHPPGRFGEMTFRRGLVSGFEEKPPDEGYINGGFMVLRRDFIDRYMKSGEDQFLEQYPMRQAVTDGEMAAFQHDGFWQCMDTAREHKLLNDLWDRGNAPWTRFWKGKNV